MSGQISCHSCESWACGERQVSNYRASRPWNSLTNQSSQVVSKGFSGSNQPGSHMTPIFDFPAQMHTLEKTEEEERREGVCVWGNAVYPGTLQQWCSYFVVMLQVQTQQVRQWGPRLCSKECQGCWHCWSSAYILNRVVIKCRGRGEDVGYRRWDWEWDSNVDGLVHILSACWLFLLGTAA